MGKTIQDLLNLVKDTNNEKYFIRLADFLVDNYTFIDDDNLINFCFKSGECKRTQLFVDEEFLVDRLNYDSKKLYFIGNLYSWLFDSVFKEYDMKDVELASIFITFYFYPKLYEKYYKPLEPDYINESIRFNIHNEERQKKYLDFIYDDLIVNTKWRDASFSEIDLYGNKCKSLQVGINWSTNPPSYSYIPICLSKYLKDYYGLTYEEINELFWGRYDRHIINMKLKRHQPYK